MLIGGSNLANFMRNMKASIQRVVQYVPFLSIIDGTTKKQMIKTRDNNYPYLQDWGFISVPPGDGGEVVIVHPNGSYSGGVAIKADCPKLRPTEKFAAGDVGLFNKEGVIVKLSGKNVSIIGADSISLGEEGSSLKALVTETALSVIKTHTHIFANGAVSTSTELATIDVGNTTTKVKAQ